MSAQDIILGARVAHLRELKTEIERLKAENAALKNENAALSSHFAQALLAARDLETGVLEIWDGWNLILGAKKEAADRGELIEKARARLAAEPELKIWIVFDGKDEKIPVSEERLRVSYTGGVGAHRADRFIVDFVRMAAYQGKTGNLRVRTYDKDFRKSLSFFGIM